MWAQWAYALVLEARNEINDAFTLLAGCDGIAARRQDSFSSTGCSGRPWSG